MDQGALVRWPVYLQKLSMRCLRLRERLQSEGKAATNADLAARLGLPETAVEAALKAGAQRAALMAQAEVSDIDKYQSRSREADPCAKAHDLKVAQMLEEWMQSLSDRQQYVVDRRFGFHRCDTRSLQSIASELGLTRERVRQIQLDALALLRKMARQSGLNLRELTGVDGLD